MKKQLKTLVMAVLAGLMLTACQPEMVQPKEQDNSDSLIDLQESNSGHRPLYPVCAQQPASFIGANGSSMVDYCPTGNCPSPPAWGTVELLSGYNKANQFTFAINYRLAYGWYATEVDTKIGNDADFTLMNGIPQIDASWIHRDVNPARNSWQFNQPATSGQCIKVAARIKISKISWFSGVDNASVRNIWVTDLPNGGMRDFLVPYCMPVCSNSSSATLNSR